MNYSIKKQYYLLAGMPCVVKKSAYCVGAKLYSPQIGEIEANLAEVEIKGIPINYEQYIERLHFLRKNREADVSDSAVDCRVENKQ